MQQTMLKQSARSVAPFRPGRLCAAKVTCVARPQRSAPVQAQTESSGPQWLSVSALAAPLLMIAQPALATGGEYGLLEGRTAALVHPAMEFFLLGATLYAGYLGWQWRRTRELGDEIRAMRASASAVAGIDAGAAPNPELAAKEEERKALLAGGYKDKHFVWGSLLLASGVGMAIEGCANTFMRTGKLFPGPHLYAGALICALWALAAAMVPAMQKGDNNARNAHIALNAIQVSLFLSQVPSGLEIVGKVFQFTSWP